MRTFPKHIVCIVALLFFAACGNAVDDVSFDLDSQGLGLGQEPDACLQLEDNQLLLSIQDQFTTLPGRVSVLFRVSDVAGNPVPGLTSEQFTIFEQGRNDDCFNTISSLESLARISSNSQVFRNTSLLVLDLSNSVLQGSLNELKTASVNFVNSVIPEIETPSFQMAIYWFDGEDELHLLQPLTSSADELASAIDSIDEDISNDPSTDLFGAVIRSTEIAEGLIRENNQNAIIGAGSVVIFTDGTDQASRFSEESALQAVKDADSNISFFTIGLGAEIDTEVLTDIGKTFSVFASDTDELETTFNQISTRVSEQANSFYLFEYCSPKRDGSGLNNLVIQVTDGGLEGAVQTQFDATGFSGGCN